VPTPWGGYFTALSRLAGEHPHADRYLVDVAGRAVRRLTTAELGALADTNLVAAGFRVPERSVSTLWIADRLVEAIHAESRIELATGTRVVAVRREDREGTPRWRIDTEPPRGAAATVVVNALWEGRIAIDAGVGLTPEPGWSHRYRQSVFLRTSRPTTLPSAVVATGPFGDVKNYNGRDLYVSWYPAGLRVEGHGLSPPSIDGQAPSAAERCARETIAALGQVIPGIRDVAAGARMRVEGGWVFALGSGSLAHAAATIHRRDRFGVRRRGGYLSVDTGKYSAAPWLARHLADEIDGSMSRGGTRSA